MVLSVLGGIGRAADQTQVRIVDETWQDVSRKREVPVRIYAPDASVPGPWPVIIFSHGLGGTREGYLYLGAYWASHGYFCVHPEHAGSNEAIYMNGDPWNTTVTALKDPQNWVSRTKDVSFVIDRLEAENRPDGRLPGKLDLKRIGVGGHSFGAFTALAVAGERFGGGPLAGPGPGANEAVHLADKRVKAAIAISERPSTSADPAKDFAEIRIPMLHMTGTDDFSPMGDVQPKERRQPFDLIPPHADQYLITFDGAAHLTFSGWRGKPGDPHPVNYQPMIRATTLRFWDAYLKDDPAALKEMRQDGLKTLIRPADRAESKLAQPVK